MRPYLLPGLALAGAGLALLAPPPGLTVPLVVLILLANAAAGLWWVVVIGRRPRPAAAHLAIVWAPAVAPAIVLWRAIRAMAEHDSAIDAVFLHLPLAAFSAMVCIAGAFIVLDRIVSHRQRMRDG